MAPRLKAVLSLVVRSNGMRPLLSSCGARDQPSQATTLPLLLLLLLLRSAVPFIFNEQFDRYEHTLDREDRRADKCLMPNPDHCGRSPATMTLDYLSVLEHSGM